MESVDYPSICTLVGKLYLELSYNLENERKQVNSLYQEINRLKNLLKENSDDTGKGNAN